MILHDGTEPDGTRSRRRHRRPLLAVGAVVAVAVLWMLVLWSRVGAADGAPPGSGPGSGSTLLLIGSDRRVAVPGVPIGRFGTATQVPGERADVVIAVRSESSQRTRALSIPRDMLATIPGGLAPERLTLLLQKGPTKVADAICQSLGIGADHLAVIRFDGLVAMIDEVGGVDIAPTTVVRDRGSGLLARAGRHRVDGATALAYIRARHVERWDGTAWIPDPEADQQRGDRALEVLSSLGRRLDLGWATPFTNPSLAWTATGAVTVDDDTGPFDTLAMVRTLRTLSNATRRSLPAVTIDGPTPMLTLRPGAAETVRWFTGGATPAKACAVPTMLARR
ncbi:MAG: LCP family protein [Microthrixaceae bacterium]